MHPFRTIRRLLVAAVLAALALAPRAALAELEPWDQERVTALAQALHVAVKDVRQAVRREPVEGIGGPRKAKEQLLETLRVLEMSANQLAKNLGEGGGQAETLPIAQKIRTLVRDARMYASRFMTTAAMQERIGPAQRALNDLGPYYFEPKEPAAS
jgi:hypothetical protein